MLVKEAALLAVEFDVEEESTLKAWGSIVGDHVFLALSEYGWEAAPKKFEVIYAAPSSPESPFHMSFQEVPDGLKY